MFPFTSRVQPEFSWIAVCVFWDDFAGASSFGTALASLFFGGVRGRRSENGGHKRGPCIQHLKNMKRRSWDANLIILNTSGRIESSRVFPRQRTRGNAGGYTM